jgi:23S rRNA (uracil1939-C5)-methyltransferase
MAADMNKRRKLPPIQSLSCTALSREGQGLADLPSGSRAAVWGLFPGEKASLSFVRRRQGFWQAEIESIDEPLPERREALEDHYLDCSPWQVLSERKQDELKLSLIKSFFAPFGLPEPIYRPASMPLAYRAKMEYSLCVQDGRLMAAFHRRGRRFSLDTLDSCVLAPAPSNKALVSILSYLQESACPLEAMQSLVIRYSFAFDELSASLFVGDEGFPPLPSPLGLRSWSVYYSDPRTPASVCGRLISRQGETLMHDKVGDLAFSYDPDGFFQACPPAFGKLLDDLRDSLPAGDCLFDLYAGVGTIGLSLAGKYQSLILSEYDARAMELAAANAESAGVADFECHAGAAEKQDLASWMSRASAMVVDPPRSGLHPKVARAISAGGPKHLAYVSCNPYTQAHDLSALSEAYEVKRWFLYDFYAQTPHAESLLLMIRK